MVGTHSVFLKNSDFYMAHFDFIRECAHRYREGKINMTISPTDTMNDEHYLSAGRSAVDCILKALSATSITSVNRVLDLPCGHGRVLRHLVALFPDAQIDASDLEKDGVAFCEKTFGVRGIVSDPDLTKAPLRGGYDLIWVGSLFTHLRRDITQRWLAHLASLLSDKGIVIATTHGRWCEHIYETVRYISEDKWMKIVSECRASGYGYASYSRQESHHFMDHDYGVSMALPSATINDIENISGVRIYGYMERGWGDHQDVVVYGRPSFDTPWR